MIVAPCMSVKVCRRMGAGPTRQRVNPFWGPAFILKAMGRDYTSLGEGIVNTLIGDLELWEAGTLVGRAEGTATLERRTPALVPAA